ncbi:hypothetical protein, partial [Streptomyces cahuitamycinicus]
RHRSGPPQLPWKADPFRFAGPPDTPGAATAAITARTGRHTPAAFTPGITVSDSRHFPGRRPPLFSA